MRGSGVDLDIRRANPYSGYENYDFEVPTETDCDVWARYLVRMREMKESHRIVAQALARLKPGPVKADAPKVVLPDREAMKKHMDALIHHFLIVAEGFDGLPFAVRHERHECQGLVRLPVRRDYPLG